MEPLFARLTVLTFLGIAAGISVNAILLQDVRVAHFDNARPGPDAIVQIENPLKIEQRNADAGAPKSHSPIKDDLPHVASLGKKKLDDKIRTLLGPQKPADQTAPLSVVKDVQARLHALDYYPGDADGIAGPTTRAAVMAYEFDHGFAQTGLADAALLQVLRGAATRPERRAKPAELSKNSQELVMALQKALTKLGYDTGSADGIMGPMTAKRIRAFERDNKLDVTGRISGRLVEAIHKAQGRPLVLASLTNSR